MHALVDGLEKRENKYFRMRMETEERGNGEKGGGERLLGRMEFKRGKRRGDRRWRKDVAT